jgi:GMP reductase
VFEWVKLQSLIQHLNPKFVCVDVANGYMSKLVSFVKRLREAYPNLVIVCGNVVSREMTEELLINGGADMIKVGIGSGSVCTTRLQTGVGMPQLSAVMECSDAAHGVGGHIISDGGITCPGDISKALGGGADFVMLGSMLSGHDESAGEMVEENGNKYKLFYGMSSSTAMNKYHGGVAKYRSSEGKTVRIKYKGAVSDTMDDILGGVRSTCTYIGATRIKDIPKCCTFMMVNRQVNTVHNGKEV